MGDLIDKEALFEALRATLQAQLDELATARAEMQQALRVDGSHRPANRGERAAVTGAGYLAHGLGQRQEALESTLALLARTAPSPRDKAVTGALVEAEDGRRWLLFPGAPGVRLGEVVVVSPTSPVGEALWELEPGEEAELPGGAVTITRIDGVGG